MRAVNLIPLDQRGGSGPAAGRSEGGAYAVLVMVAGLALLAFLYGTARHEISSRRAKAASLVVQTQRAQAMVAQLAPYTSFLAMREQRVKAVSELAQSRFDWAHAFHELGRVLPADASITSLTGTVGSASGGSTTSTLGLELNGSSQRRRHLGHPAGQRADVHPQRVRNEPDRGRADAQPTASDRRRQQRDTAELHQAER